MAFPPGLNPKTVTIGIASFFDGTIASGRATISAPVNVLHTPSNRPIFSSDITAQFVDGAVTFNLLPTDAPGLNRVDWAYKLKVEVTGASVQPEVIYFTLPTAGPDVVDLDGLVTVPSSAGVPIAVDVLTAQDITSPTSDVNVALRASLGSGTNAADVGYDLILLLGQSNMVGNNTDADVARFDTSDPRVWAYQYTGALARVPSLSIEPMAHQDGTHGVGPGLPFARWYAASIPTNRRVLLVPAAYSGTPFEGLDSGGGTHTWKVSAPDNGNSLYKNALRQARAALAAAGPHARIAAALWVQGESDAVNGTSGTTYQADLDALIGQLRTDLGLPNLPFILGGMEPGGVSGDPARQAIAAVHAATPGRVAHTFYAPGPVSFDIGDGLHYNAAGQRRLGRAMFQAWVDGAPAAYPPISDNFTRADSTTGIGPSSDGGRWTPLVGTWGISGNQAYDASNTSGAQIARSLAGTDQFAEARVSGTAVVYVRGFGADNWCGLLATGGTLAVWQSAAGNVSQILAAGAAADGDRIRIEAVGTALKIYRNGTQVATGTDPAPISGKIQVGLRTNDSSARFGDFAAGTL